MTAATINGKKPKFFTTPIADSGTKTDIPATGGDDTVSQQQGFPSKFSTPRGSGGKSVGRSDMNGLFNGVSSLNYYFQYTGRNPWVSGQSYPKGAKVYYDKNDTDKAEYVSTKDDNTDTPGASGVTTWIKLNDLSGTSGGGTTVDCAWSSRASEIGGLLSNAGIIPNIETSSTSMYDKINTLSGDVDSLTRSVSSLQTSVSGISTKLDNLSVKPAFLDFSKAECLNPIISSTVEDRYLEKHLVTVAKDGRLFVSYHDSPKTTHSLEVEIFIGNSTSPLSRICVLGRNYDYPTAPSLTNDVYSTDNFSIDVKTGSSFTFSKIAYRKQATSGAFYGNPFVILTFVPYVT